MSDGSSPLTRCPVCRYDLTGLPANYRCPECGFEYDETMQAWVAPVSRWWLRGALLLFPLTLGFPALDQLFLGVVKPVATGILRQVFLFAYIVVLLAATALVFIRLRGHVAVVIADCGLILISRFRETIALAWGELWIPDPGGRRSVPPWVTEANKKLMNASWLRRFLYRERGVWAERFTVYQAPETKRKYPKGRAITLPIRGSARRAAMAEVYRRWLQANQGET